MVAKDELPSNGCFAIEVTPSRGGKLAVLIHSANGQLQRLVPNGCNAAGVNTLAINPGAPARIPTLSGAESVFDFDGGAGKEWVYALLAPEGDDAREYDKLVSTVPDLCGKKAPYVLDVNAFQAQLKKLGDAGAISWATAEVAHR